MRGVIAAATAAWVLAGCSSIGGFTGAVASIATSIATANPVVGLSVGIGVKAATDEAIKTVSRRRSQTEQDAIAAVVGDMEVGESRAWRARHFAHMGGEHGDVRVVRVIETPLALCKEMLFSVVQGPAQKPSRTWFATTACRQGDQWKWAAAEPAVERWGALQ